MSLLALPLVIAHVVAVASPATPLITVAERSGFVRTGRYDEVIALCDAFQRAHPKSARCESFGTTPEGRDMKALVLADDIAKASDRPAVLAQGGIHAGEIDGKDAGFLLARELLEGTVAKDALKTITFVFVPVFNIDGHERMTKNNRPNQRGPEEMGWRTTSWNLNLNRDYVKAEAPEMQAMIRLLNKYNPALYIDLHVTDGAQFQHDVAVMVDARRDGTTGKIFAGAAAMQARVIGALNGTRKDIGGHLALDFYPSFEKYDDPSSGAGVGAAPPRFSQTYWATRGGVGMLVETHSWKNYKTRVKATHDVLVAVLEDAREHVLEWRPPNAGAPLDPRADYVLGWENSDAKTTIDFQGFKYTRELSPISGALMTTYDEKKPEVWKMPFLTGLKPALSVKAPNAYLVPCGHASWMMPKLTLHGLDVAVVDKPQRAAMNVEEYRASEVTFGSKPYEARTTAKVKGDWTKRKHTPRNCDLLVKATPLAVHLFEPNGPDSLLQWGYFNAIFEQKEYMEPYVAEAVAKEMMRDPKVREEFLKKLEDPTFASDPDKRLDFFYRKHPSFDAQMNVYPVLRVVD